MGKPTGFLEIERQVSTEVEPLKRIKNFNEFHKPCQGARCMDCGVPFCQNGKMIQGMVSGCPLNNLIPEWNDLIFHKNYKAALKRLLKTNNFPEFTSRVCPALCEAACTCGLNGNPVTVRENENAIIETAYASNWMQPHPPKHRIDRRIELMEEEGVVFKTNAGIENRKQVQQLYKEFDRVILACGSKKARDIKAPGRDAKGIYFAVDYLTGITKSLLNSQLEDQTFVETKGKNVLVIGGGDTGNDCVGSAIRLGCKSVIQLEMMPEPPHERLDSNPWPEWPRVKKTDYGQNESIAVFGHDPRLYQTTVKEFIKDDKGNVKQVVIVSLESKQVEGRMQMVPVKGSEKTLDADIVLIAAGFVGCEDYVAKAFDVKLTPRGNVADENYQTNQKQLYVAGDMRRGQSLVVWAIREGREVARAVDEDLMGYSNL